MWECAVTCSMNLDLILNIGRGSFTQFPRLISSVPVGPLVLIQTLSIRLCRNLRFHGSPVYILIIGPHTTPAEQSSPQIGWRKLPKTSWDSVASPKTDATISGQYKVTRLTASSLGRGYVCRCHVFLSPLCCRVSEWRHLLQQRHRGLAEGLNHSHGNVRHWERADKHKHSPYRKAQTWKTTP